jgi:hypothetical protein
MAAAFIITQAEMGLKMDAYSQNGRRLVEALEGRSMMSAVAYGDFNNDGRVDMAAVTAPTTITVSLLNANGSYTVSATLTAPNHQPVTGVTLRDVNGDGRLDIAAGGVTNNRFYTHTWLGNGNGTFGNRTTEAGRVPKWFV